jgi:hypothetical protein
MLRKEQGVIRQAAVLHVALLLAVTLAPPAYAQTVPAPAAKATKPSPPKPAAKKPEPPQPDGAAEHGPCIGVIPHIGKYFEVQTIGLFSYDDKNVPIEPWGLDDLVVTRVRATAGPRFAVRGLTYPANAPEPYRSLLHSPEDDIKSVAQTVAPAGGCERYVVVVRSGSQYASTRYWEIGIGIVNGPTIRDLGGVSYLFALTTLYVVDGHTFDVLKKGDGSVDGQTSNPLLGGLLRAGPIHGPSRELKDFAWPPAPDAVMGLREPTRALLAASLDVALPRLLWP